MLINALITIKMEAELSERNGREQGTGSLINKNIMVEDRRTSVRLEAEMWNDLRDICRREGKSMQDICTMVAQRKLVGRSLTSAIRVFLIGYYRSASTEEGHNRAGHGEHYVIKNRISADGLNRALREKGELAMAGSIKR